MLRSFLRIEQFSSCYRGEPCHFLPGGSRYMNWRTSLNAANSSLNLLRDSLVYKDSYRVRHFSPVKTTNAMEI